VEAGSSEWQDHRAPVTMPEAQPDPGILTPGVHNTGGAPL